MEDNLLLNSFLQLLETHCGIERVRQIESGGDGAALWDAIEESGFSDALVPESTGGAGLGLEDIFPLVIASGEHLLPAPLAETMIARAVLHLKGGDVPKGSLTLAQAGIVAPEAAAAITAALMAGAMQRVFDMTLSYANDRTQFGKPIGKFQAVQHQLSVLAEHVFAVRIAAQLAFAGPGPLPDELKAAAAKARASEAVPVVTSTAHAVHGAIGITEEYDLQLYTRRLIAWRLMHGGEQYWQKRLGESLLASGQDMLPFICNHIFTKV